MTEQDQAALAEVVRAAKARMEREQQATPPRTYVLVHSVCGHVGGYANERGLLTTWKIKLLVHGHKGWRVEERDVIESEAIAMLDDERCGECTIDGNLRSVMRASITQRNGGGG